MKGLFIFRRKVISQSEHGARYGGSHGYRHHFPNNYHGVNPAFNRLPQRVVP